MFRRTISAIGIAVLVAFAPPVAQADTHACSVEAIEGDEARYWSAGAWSPLQPGQPVALEAKVATGPETRVKIACANGTVVTVGIGTEVNLESLAASGRTVIMQLIEGIVGLVTPEDLSAFDVRTPVAIASVRSTKWLVEHRSAEGSAVFARAGRVVVRARAGGWFTLEPGEGISIAQDGTPGAVKSWGPPRIARSTEALGFDWR